MRLEGFHIIVAFMVLFFVLTCVLLFYRHDEFQDNYDEIKFEYTYRGEIVELERERGVIYFELKDDGKYRVIDSKNNLYSPSHLYTFVEVGDIFEKPGNTDSLYIFREDKKYVFVIGKSIN